MKKTIFILLILSSLIAGCGAMTGIEASINRNQLDNLKVGMSTDRVRNAMGKPYKSEFLGSKLIWYYITEWQSDGKTTPEELTPLVFENDTLLGWGYNFLDNKARRYSSRRR
jgi:outer membrane protein assembly factor BamE (lipoprotein component of BamABCDE complex)